MLQIRIATENQTLNNTLAAVVSTVRGCASQTSLAETPALRKEHNLVLELGYVDLADGELCEKIVAKLQSAATGSSFPRLIVIADNIGTGVDSLQRQKSLLKSGVYEFLERPVNLQRLRYLIESSIVEYKYHLKTSSTYQQNIAVSSELERKIIKLANFDNNILLTGETGTGKTYWAEKIHQHSKRSHHKFVVVNCANFTAPLAESQLFGHVKGAFTGADTKQIGKFEHAGAGTIFLDELDSLPMEVQGKLLRVVEEREFRSLGDNKTKSMNARIISATNRNLDAAVEAGKFRSDLFFRLNVYEINIPALREQTEEIESFCRKFADEFARNNHLQSFSFEDGLLQLLCHYPWPGNIREIRNVIERGAIDTDDQVIRLENLPPKIVQLLQNNEAETEDEAVSKTEKPSQSISDATRLIQTLHKNNFNRSKTANELGVSRMTVYNLLKKYGIN